MKGLRHNTTRMKRFLNDEIWNIDLEELSKAKARFIKYMKVLLITIKTFSGEKIGFQAVALSFFSCAFCSCHFCHYRRLWPC